MKYKKWGIAFLVGVIIGAFRVDYPWQGEGVTANIAHAIGSGFGAMALLALYRIAVAIPGAIRRWRHGPAPASPLSQKSEPRF